MGPKALVGRSVYDVAKTGLGRVKRFHTNLPDLAGASCSRSACKARTSLHAKSKMLPVQRHVPQPYSLQVAGRASEASAENATNADGGGSQTGQGG